MSPVARPVVGETLPPLAVPVTTTLIVAGAIASRDYQDVHHDAALARRRGAPDIFMNILTTNGLVGRFVTDWAGPAARLRAVRIRLGTPAHPGDTLQFTGEVTALDGDRVDIAVAGTTDRGTHVSGSVEVLIPHVGEVGG